MNRLKTRALRTAAITLSIFAMAALAGCDDSGGSSEEHLSRALEHRAEYRLRAAVIELKNALQQDPKDAAARGYLGITSLDLGDIASAKKELERAQDLNWPVELLVGPLSRVWMLQGEFNKVLDEFVVADELNAVARARVLAARSEAWRGLRDLAKAEKEINAARSAAPDEAIVYVELARLEMQRRDVEAATVLVEKAVSLNPDDPNVLAVRGDLAFVKRDFPEAETAYLELTKIQNGNPFTLLPLARVMLVNGKTDEAIAELDKALRQIPRHPDANFLRSRAAYEKKDYEGAMNAAAIVLEVAPGHLPSRLLAGSSSYAVERYQLATAHLEKYLAADPDNEAARRLLAVTQLRLGKSADSLETLRPLVSENVDDARLLALAGQAALQSRDFDASQRYFKQASQAEPDNARALAQLGVVETAAGNIDAGISDLEKAIDADPSLNEAVLALGLANLRARRYDAAIDAARKFQANNSESTVGYMLEGIANLGLEKFVEAKGLFEKVLEIRPGAPDASANLAALDIRDGNTDAARKRLVGVFEHFPADVGTMFRLADIEARGGDITRAEEWLEKAEDSQPDAVEPKLRLAQLMLQGNRAEQSLEKATSVLATQPENLLALEIAGRSQLALAKWSDARTTLTNLTGLAPQSAPAAYLLSIAYRSLNSAQNYRAQLDKALELDPRLWRAKEDLAIFAARAGETDLARKHLIELKTEFPESQRVSEIEGLVAMRQGDFKKASGLFENALESRKTTDLVLSLANAQKLGGDSAAATTTLQNWVETYKQDTRTRFVLSSYQLEARNYKAAEENLNLVLTAVPRNVPALNNLAWVLLKQDRSSESLPLIERALSLVPGDPSVMDTAGLVYLDLGRNQDAVVILRKAVRALPENTEIRLHLAQALVGADLRDEARTLLNEMLGKSGNFPERKEAEELLKRL